MLTTRLVPACVLAMVTLAACGSSGGGGAGGGALDCAFLASDNCWKTTLAAASSCLPQASDAGVAPTGMLSADGKTCTYTSGQLVTFDPPVTLPLPNTPLWNFTLTSNGGACLRFQQPDQSHFSATTSAGTVSVGADASSYAVTCPNGMTYATSTQAALQLLSCDAGAFGGLPGTEDVSSSNSVAMGVLGAGAMGAVSVFDCQR